MPPLFIGGHPAIDFLNTRFAPKGESVECIADGRSYLDWLTGVGLISAAESERLRRRLGIKVADVAAADARKMREWVRDWLARWRTSPKDPFEEEVAALNKLLARESCCRELVQTGEGLRLIESVELDSSASLLALLAAQVAALLTTEQASLIKQCAGEPCTLWFVDRTKAHKRLYCSAAVCGNRAKVAAFRERQRG